ncbi:hypothetical protein ACWC2M_32840, partial [Streptomyces sp. NPDC001761]
PIVRRAPCEEDELSARPVRCVADVLHLVLNTPGACELIDNLVSYAMLPAGPRSIAIGCAGGL